MDSAAKHKTLADEAYSRLRHDVIHGEFTPGAKLRIEELRRAYEVGATPIREALHRLSAEGFVDIEGQRGFKAADLSVRELQELTELRIVIEGLATRESLEKCDENWESRVVAAFHHLAKVETQENPDPIEWETRNEAFHLALISCCESQWLRRIYTMLYDQHKRYRYLARAEEATGGRNIHGEHIEILDAAVARDLTCLLSAQEKHIRATADAMVVILGEQPGEEPGEE